jgi:hypothetical protein
MADVEASCIVALQQQWVLACSAHLILGHIASVAVVPPVGVLPAQEQPTMH